jgi:hypothetical protein
MIPFPLIHYTPFGITGPPLHFWVFAPSSGSFCAPVLLNALSDAAFLAVSTA